MEGADFVFGGWPMGLVGREVVYDFATMERSKFSFSGGQVGNFVTLAGGTAYWGKVEGFPFGTGKDIWGSYEGITNTFSAGASFGEAASVGLGRSIFWSDTDWALNGLTTYVGGGLGANMVVDLSFGITDYSHNSSITSYAVNGSVNRPKLTLMISCLA